MRKKKTRIQKGSVARGPASLGSSGNRYAVVMKGNFAKGSMNLGTAKNRYTASVKLAEEAKEATQKVMKKMKQQNTVEINPEKDLVGGMGIQQSTT